MLIVGFCAAIQMLFERAQRRENRRGYTDAVDYWSLGVTIFVLLTTLLPFPPDKVADFVDFIEDQRDAAVTCDPPAYARWYSWVSDSVTLQLMSDDCKSVLTGLLTIDDTVRLGSGLSGVKMLKQHPWFDCISWGLLEQKLMVPPNCQSIEERSSTSVREPYSCFDTMLHDIGEEFVVCKYTGGILPSQQDYFRSW